VFLWNWLLDAVSWILVFWHQLFAKIWGADSGWSWGLAIVGLVVVIRLLLVPLFVRQIKAQRAMQAIQPQLKALQTKYAGDRERQSQEMMKLYKESGTNPFASCLPIIAQAPIFFALFRVLQYGIAKELPIGVFEWPQYQPLLSSAHNAQIFGVPLYGTFANAGETPHPVNTQILAIVLIVLMSVTTFITQRQLIMKNTAGDNPIAQQMKIMMYVMPLIIAVGGLNFPIGVLIYWFTTNLWTMGQQFWVIHRNPTPGSPAAEAHAQRAARKAEKGGAPAGTVSGSDAGVIEGVIEPTEPTPKPRSQPKRQSKSKRSGNAR
jgi:YidC/Oxa1 family membrane protein insertase